MSYNMSVKLVSSSHQHCPVQIVEHMKNWRNRTTHTNSYHKSEELITNENVQEIEAHKTKPVEVINAASTGCFAPLSKPLIEMSCNMQNN